MPEVTKDQVLDALRAVKDPDLGRDIVACDFVKEVKICEGTVGVTIELTTPACPVKEQLKSQADQAIRGIAGVSHVDVTMTAQTVGRNVGAQDILKGVKNCVAVGSGKGGVGKSTATVNLALALAQSGAKVGILDADIYGPSVPGMLGITDRPMADDDGRAIPPMAFGIKAMSVGMLVGEDAPTIWRGPIASRLLQQFLGAVNWGELDYLLLDLPPGTGDIQLTLTQSAPLNGAVIVTTPQQVAMRIAKKGLKMFQQVNIPILGLLENMAGSVFGTNTTEKVAREMGVPFLGSIPLDPKMVESGDLGVPLVALDKDAPGSKAFFEAAARLASQLSISNLQEKSVQDRPKQVLLAEQRPPKIVWDDGSVMIYDARKLRLACPCAGCRDEMTNERIVNEQQIPMNIAIAEARPVGRYGLSIAFNDGHGSGIYTFNYLRELGQKL
ncbi:MAG: iron-sulfur cluster carrier protein [Planctomycetota bacterium]